MQNSAEYQARCDLAAAHRIAVMDQLNEGSWNHLSLMSPDVPEHMLISPGDTHWSQVNASNLAVMGPQGEMVSGPTPPNGAAWIIHYPIHRARTDAKCLLHAHPPYTTALGMRKNSTVNTLASQPAATLHDDIAYFDVYDGVLDDEEEGERMAETLGDKRVLMLRNHGVCVAGATVGSAYVALLHLERACMYQLLATADDSELNVIPEQIAVEMTASARSSRSDGHFEAMKRVIDEREPDYMN